MNQDELFHFTTTTPPDASRFSELGRYVSLRLSQQIEGELQLIEEHVEPESWVTNKVFIGDRTRFQGECYFGVVSYSLRNGEPSITSVLLMFRDGERVVNGRDSILVSTFTKTGWETFKWQDDEFDEWECDRITDLMAIAG